MQFNNIPWAAAEEAVARHAFDIAYQREMKAIIADVKKQAELIYSLDDVWKLHDFLSVQRHELDGKYDYRYEELPFVFARLVKEGWLQLSELDGLDPEKLTKISVLTRI